MAIGLLPTANDLPNVNLPSPCPNKIPILLVDWLAKAISSRPSLLKSPTANVRGLLTPVMPAVVLKLGVVHCACATSNQQNAENRAISVENNRFAPLLHLSIEISLQDSFSVLQ